MSIVSTTLTPVISEKSSNLTSKYVFAFYVNKNLNKLQIKNYFSKLFAVEVISVRSLIMKKLKKRKRLKPKSYILKKVYITISPDSNLDRINSIF